MRGFLLDSNVTAALISSVKRVAPACEIVHLAKWRRGSYLHAGDDEILEKACEDDLILVTHDVSTIPSLVHEWITQARPIVGVVVITSRSGRVTDVGGLATALGELYAHPHLLDPAYPVVYLRPAP